MKDQITVIKPEEFGLEKKQALTIEEAFLPKIKEGEILSNQYSELIKKDITHEVCDEATQLGRKLVKVRTGIADVHKTQKAFFFAAGKFVDAKKNKETLPITHMEEGVKKIKNHFAEIEEAKNEVIRQERNAELEKYDKVYDIGDIALMDNELWGHFLNGVKADYEAKKAEEARIEKERIEAQKKEDLFYARKEKLIQFSQFNIQNELTIETTEKEFIALVEKGEAMKKEFKALQERIKAENEKLKKEAELKLIADKKAEIERQRLAKIEQDKRDKIERERQAKAEAERKEREKQEAKAKAEHEAALKIEREEKERIQKELQAKEDAERKGKKAEVDRLKSELDAKRKAELAPDKERMTKWIADMEIIDIVNDRMSKESVLMASEIIDKFNKFKTWATEKVNEIK